MANKFRPSCPVGASAQARSAEPPLPGRAAPVDASPDGDNRSGEPLSGVPDEDWRGAAVAKSGPALGRITRRTWSTPRTTTSTVRTHAFFGSLRTAAERRLANELFFILGGMVLSQSSAASPRRSR